MTKYEYLIEIVAEGNLQAALDAAGKAGWLLACAPAETQAGFRLIFYRVKGK